MPFPCNSYFSTFILLSKPPFSCIVFMFLDVRVSWSQDSYSSRVVNSVNVYGEEPWFYRVTLMMHEFHSLKTAALKARFQSTVIKNGDFISHYIQHKIELRKGKKKRVPAIKPPLHL